MLRPGDYQCAPIRRFARGGGPGCALLAGSITSIKPGPFQIGTREDRAQRPCRSPAALQGLAESGFQIEKPRHVILAHDVPFTVRVGAVEQETSLSIGLGKP